MQDKAPAPENVWTKYLYPSAIILACLLFGCVLGVFIGCSRSMGELTIDPPETTIVYDIKQREVGRFFDLENREPVSLNQVSRAMREAIVAIEDERFYSHRGIDLRAIARAAWADIKGGGYVQGGSTITQQLARNALLSQRKLMTRKIREAFYAMAIERKYSKDEILEFYLNQIYFGHGAYGVQCAAKVFFGKEAKDLTLAESALLAGIARSPGKYDPYLDPKAARDRRETVLDKMLELGYITAEQYEEAKSEPLGVVPLKPRKRRAAYFLEYVERQLAEKFEFELDTAGLRIYTTLDNDVQAAAEAMLEQMRPGKKDSAGVEQPQIALVALDPATGHIQAMLGGRDYGNTQLNRADRAYRQPASTIKPFIYTAAIDSKEMTPSTIVVDEEVSFPNPDGSQYKPRNYDGGHRGPVTLLEALEQSINVVAVKLVDHFGPSKVARYARNMGLTSLVLSGEQNDINLASLALGGLTRGVTPLELAAAYTPLANRGIQVEPIGILKVTDRHGTVLYEAPQNRRRVVLSEATAYVMTNMLRRVVTHGTGRAAYIGDYHPVAGKTGTATNNVNAWFVGYTPTLLACVWLGNDRQTEPLPYGSGEAARLWGVFMRKAMAGRPAASFVPPATGVTGEIAICKASGELFTDQCPVEAQDFAVYLTGTEPRTHCSLHTGAYDPTVIQGGQDTPVDPTDPAYSPVDPGQAVTERPDGNTVSLRICRESGSLANAFCPEDAVEVRSFRLGDEPAQYCTAHGPWSMTEGP